MILTAGVALSAALVAAAAAPACDDGPSPRLAALLAPAAPASSPVAAGAPALSTEPPLGPAPPEVARPPAAPALATLIRASAVARADNTAPPCPFALAQRMRARVSWKKSAGLPVGYVPREQLLAAAPPPGLFPSLDAERQASDPAQRPPPAHQPRRWPATSAAPPLEMTPSPQSHPRLMELDIPTPQELAGHLNRPPPGPPASQHLEVLIPAGKAPPPWPALPGLLRSVRFPGRLPARDHLLWLPSPPGRTSRLPPSSPPPDVRPAWTTAAPGRPSARRLLVELLHRAASDVPATAPARLCPSAATWLGHYENRQQVLPGESAETFRAEF